MVTIATHQPAAVAQTYHVTRTASGAEGLRDAYGHVDTTCDASGCAGTEQYLGSYDPAEVEHDGETYWTVTSSGLTVTLPEQV